MEKKIYYLIAVVALAELALSQFHIESITALFSSSIGIYLFGFIITGLIAIFNASKLEDNKYLSLVSSLVFAVGFGIIYILMMVNDVQANEFVKFYKVWSGFVLGIIGIAGYALALILTTKEYIKFKKN